MGGSSKEGPEGSHQHQHHEVSWVKRLLWSTAGTISLALGVIGIAIPVMPTTPFLLLAAACYLRGSKRMYAWLMKNRWFGTYLLDYMEGRGIPVATKIVSLVLLWSAIGLSAAFVVTSTLLRVLLFAVAVGVTIHLAMVKTR
jgi:uncharacterized membrane protein YbaN (DUF454 family)